MKAFKILFLGLTLTSIQGVALAAQPCEGDAEKLCPKMSFGEIAKCLHVNEAKLSVACRQTLNAGVSQSEQCKAAIKANCSSSVIGEGLGKCFVEKEKIIAPACRSGDK